jgi:hypothetical protein
MKKEKEKVKHKWRKEIFPLPMILPSAYPFLSIIKEEDARYIEDANEKRYICTIFFGFETQSIFEAQGYPLNGREVCRQYARHRRPAQILSRLLFDIINISASSYPS